MPQKLSRVRPNATGCSFTADDGPSAKRPELAVLVTRVITEWALLDSYMSGVFVTMLGTNPHPGAAVYATLISNAIQQQAIRAVARLALNEGLDDILEAILSLYGAAAKDRNKIAHWVWGITPDLPDRALVVEPSVLVSYHAEFTVYEDAKIRGAAGGPEPIIDFDAIFVYGASDFTSLSTKIQRLIQLVVRFRNVLILQVHTGPAHDIGLLSRYAARLNALSNEPEIRDLILRRKAARNKEGVEA